MWVEVIQKTPNGPKRNLLNSNAVIRVLDSEDGLGLQLVLSGMILEIVDSWDYWKEQVAKG
jgi:hypothetical protein